MSLDTRSGADSGPGTSDDPLGDAFYPLFSSLFSENSDFVSGVETKLAQARMTDPVEMYISRALGIGVLAGGFLWLIGTLLGYVLFATGVVEVGLLLGARIPNETLLAVVGDVVAEHGIDETSTVALSARLTKPGALVAGVLAPLSVGATVVLPDGADDGGQTEGTEPALWVLEEGREDDRTAVRAGDVTASLRDTRRA